MERQTRQPERRVVFIDGDRCFWRTERFMDIIYDVLERHGISRAQMAEMKQKTEAEGGSFDTFETLRGMYDGALVDQMGREVESEALSRKDLPYEDERCLLMPGARELMSSIPPHNRVMLTRGGEEMQLLKLRGIAGIDTDTEMFEITDRSDKGRMLVEAFVPEKNKFVFRWIRNAGGDIEATHATLVEDKGKAFAGLELLGDRANGFWYHYPDEPQLPSQQLPAGMTLPPNVEVISSLYSARDAIVTLGGTALEKSFARS